MPIQMIPNYRTSDGTTHENIDAAASHERHLLLVKTLFDDGRAPVTSLDAIAELVIRTYPSIRQIMDTDLKREMLDDRAAKRAAAATEMAPPKIALSSSTTPKAKAIDAYGAVLYIGDTVKLKVGLTDGTDLMFGDLPFRTVEHIRNDGEVALNGDGGEIWFEPAVLVKTLTPTT